MRRSDPPRTRAGSCPQASQPSAQPQGFVCLMIADAGSSNSPINCHAASRSTRLLYESSLPCNCSAPAIPRLALRVKRSRLMRIFAVAQRKSIAARECPASPAAARSSAESRRGARILRDRKPRWSRTLSSPDSSAFRVDSEPSLARSSSINGRVIGARRHHRDVLIIFRRRANHRRAADVDVLDQLRQRRVLFRGDLLELVEIHAHQVDFRDAVRLDRAHVLRPCERMARIPPAMRG